MRKTALISLAAVTAGVILSVVVGEGIVRLLRLAPLVNELEIDRPYGRFVSSDNLILKYVPKPGSLDINAYGIRDYEYALHKPPGTFRILVVGDSVAFGFCTDTETLPIDVLFAKQLEQRLNARAVPGIEKFEVINLSVSGYDTIQEVEFLYQKGLPLHPDFVILAYCLNDIWTASAELWHFRQIDGWFELPPLVPQVVSTGFRASHLARFLWQRATMLQSQDEPSDARPRVGLKRLRELADLHQFEVMMTIFPLFEDFEQYPRKAEHAWAWTEAKRNQFDVVDLLEAFRVKSEGNLKALQGRCVREHPDEAGHMVAAEMIEDYLLAKVMQKSAW